MNVEIFGTKTCVYCKQAAALCESKSIDYTYVDLVDKEQVNELEQRIGESVRTVPVILVDDTKLPNGYIDLKNMISS